MNVRAGLIHRTGQQGDHRRRLAVLALKIDPRAGTTQGHDQFRTPGTLAVWNRQTVPDARGSRPLAFHHGVQHDVAIAEFALIVQQIEGWFLTPRIMGNRTGLHFMAIIVAIFFWGTALGGILGMILAIPLTAFLASFWRLLREKYIPQLI